MLFVLIQTAGKFELIRIVRDSEISKAYCSPTKTGAVQILNWIKDNDAELSLQEPHSST